ncbi:MAG TPA: heavy-metal-associated domain-containing protein [Trebonia sp.]|jgi:copper chaperone CopZ|nr:heavy-metal-associated domain-containing protein [Trebonia sp.]
MASATYYVTGMTCEHCERAVRGELRALDGVSDVTVDLVAGGASVVTVVSDVALARPQVEAALDEAGDYRLADDAADPGSLAAAPERQLPLPQQ